MSRDKRSQIARLSPAGSRGRPRADIDRATSLLDLGALRAGLAPRRRGGPRGEPHLPWKRGDPGAPRSRASPTSRARSWSGAWTPPRSASSRRPPPGRGHRLRRHPAAGDAPAVRRRPRRLHRDPGRPAVRGRAPVAPVRHRPDRRRPASTASATWPTSGRRSRSARRARSGSARPRPCGGSRPASTSR